MQDLGPSSFTPENHTDQPSSAGSDPLVCLPQTPLAVVAPENKAGFNEQLSLLVAAGARCKAHEEDSSGKCTQRLLATVSDRSR